MVQMDYAGKLQRCHGYVEALEEERRKIQVFQRELPLCLELLSHAIEACRRDLSGAATSEYLHGQSECSEQTSSEGPVLAEFIPIKKRTSSCSDGNDDYEINGEQQSHQRNRISDNGNSVKDQNNCDLKKKSEWLRSVQLWNQSPDPPPKVDVPRKVVVTEMQRNSGAFQPFHRESSVGKSNNNRTPADVPNAVPASATSGTAETAVGGGPRNGGTSGKEEMEEQQPQRKQRRCWSPELHRRFLSALQQLGGSQAATPKQIRELMKVDGLTNDEVKSHLQKYRLHTRRPSPTIHNNGTPQAHQFIVVGGIWPPPPEYTAVAATITSGETATIATASGIYAPAAAAPPEAPQVDISSVQKPDPAGSKKLQSEGRGSHGEGGSHSSSPSPSSFTHAITNSPVF